MLVMNVASALTTLGSSRACITMFGWDIVQPNAGAGQVVEHILEVVSPLIRSFDTLIRCREREQYCAACGSVTE